MGKPPRIVLQNKACGQRETTLKACKFCGRSNHDPSDYLLDLKTPISQPSFRCQKTLYHRSNASDLICGGGGKILNRIDAVRWKPARIVARFCHNIIVQ